MKEKSMKEPIKQIRTARILLVMVGLGIAVSATTRSSATVVAWGDNTYGQSSSSQPKGVVGAKAVAAGYWHNLAVTAAGNVVAWGLDDSGQTNVPAGLSNIVAVAAGHDHSIALKQNGAVVGWGDNEFGQTNIPVDLTNAIAVSAGAFHNAALRADGTVTCWGYNAYGQTNVPASVTNAVAVACGNSFSLALLRNGTIIGWGDNYYGQTNIPVDLTNAVAIAAGGFHGIAIRSDGSVTCWGGNDYGQTNCPSDVTNVLMVSGGYYHSLALRSDGGVKQWGDTSLGQRNPPAGLTQVLALAGGYAHSLVLEDDKPFITIQPQDVTVATNKSAKFLILATGAAPFSNHWWRVDSPDVRVGDGWPVSNANGVVTLQFSVNSGTSNAVRNYYGLVSNAWGAVTSRVATLNVVAPPTITSQPQSVAASIGATVFLTVGASGGEPFSYQWQFGGTNLASAASTNVLELDNVGTNDAGNYRVIVANAAGFATSGVAVVTVGGSPVIQTQPQSQSAAQGGSATFSVVAGGTEPLSYQWWFNSTRLIPDATNSSLVFNSVQATNAGNYSVIVTNLFGCATSTPARLSVMLPPVITAQPQDVTVAANQSVTFTMSATGTQPLSNHWWRVGSPDDWVGDGRQTTNLAGLATFQFSVNSGTSDAVCNYYGVVSNAWGAVTSRVATLTVETPPIITNQPQSVAASIGMTVFLTVGASGREPLSYQWQFNGTNLTLAASTNMLELDNVSTNDSGNYRVIVANVAGSVTSAVAVVAVGGPVIQTQPQSQSVVQGGSATFSVVAGGEEPLSYQWCFNLTNQMTAATNASLVIDSVQTTNVGSYSVIVTNQFGCATSTVARLSVMLQPAITIQPQDAVVAANSSATFMLSATGTQPLSNHWWRVDSPDVEVGDGAQVTNLNGVTKFRFSVNSGTDNAVCGYYGVVSNAWGAVTTRVAVLTVVMPPAITNQPQSMGVGIGTTVLLSVGASGGEPLSYQWQFNGTNLASSGSTNVLELDNVGTNNAGNYRVILTNIVGSATSQIAKLIVGYRAVTPAQLWLLTHSTSGGDSLLIALEAGKNYRIQASSNLSTWDDVTNFLSSSEVMVFTNGLVTNLNQLFYRVTSP
jgi:hypothetical protein